jgi:hypothetical protein
MWAEIKAAFYTWNPFRKPWTRPDKCAAVTRSNVLLFYWRSSVRWPLSLFQFEEFKPLVFSLPESCDCPIFVIAVTSWIINSCSNVAQRVLTFQILLLLFTFRLVVTQAVSRRLPTAAARVRARVRSCRICGGQSGTGERCLWVLRFPLPILIPPTAPHWPSSIIRGWYNSPISGRRTKWTQSHPTRRN